MKMENEQFLLGRSCGIGDALEIVDIFFSAYLDDKLSAFKALKETRAHLRNQHYLAIAAYREIYKITHPEEHEKEG